MRRIRSFFLHGTLAVSVGGFVLLSSGSLPLVSQDPSISSAYAVVGRPLTPMSYAGVARRTTRRPYGVGVAPVVIAPVVVAPVVVAPVCTQAVDIYGRVYTRC